MADFDLIIRGGTIYDGSGGEPFVADVAVKDGLIAQVGAVTGTATAVPTATPCPQHAPASNYP